MVEAAGGDMWERFAAVAEASPRRPALIYGDERYSYADLKGLAEAAAGGLAGLGVESGQRVLLLLPHCPEWVAAWLAVVRLEAIAVPVSPLLPPRDLAFLLDSSGAAAIVAGDDSLAAALEAAAKAPSRPIVVHAGRSRPSKGHAGVVSLRQMFAHGTAAPARSGQEAADLCEILYTSGTTGRPKGVPIGHRALADSAVVQRANSLPLIPPGEDVIVQSAPLYHILGQAFAFGALLSGERVVLLPRMDIALLLEAIERNGVKTLFGTPTLFRMILAHEDLGRHDLSSLRYCFSGGEALKPALARDWLQRVGVPLYQGYGATEAVGAIAMVPPGIPCPEGTLGRVAPGRQVMLVDPETLRPVPPREAGEALVSGPVMPTSYWNDPDESRRSFVPIAGQTWYRTGDVVSMDEDGWLFFVDRTADIIKHKGYRIAPARIESVIAEHPAVGECCVIGVPHPLVGESIKAFVVPRLGAVCHPDDLAAWCRARLLPYEAPERFELVSSLPKSPSGKVLRRVLREREREAAATSDPG